MHFLQINNSFASATISLYGGQVLSYLPHGQKDVLWMSKKAIYQKGKAIRGGIPICWPWFGDKEGMPSHGFARILPWTLQNVEDLQDNSTKVVLTLGSNDQTKEWWNYDFQLEIEITVGNQLEIKLTTHNSGEEAFSITEALHSYYQVSGIKDISITGLDGHAFFNKLNKEWENEDRIIKLSAEKDSVYPHDGLSTINDPRWDRKISIEKSESNSTIIWNPWDETTKSIRDIEHKAYREFICLEAGNVTEPVIISPGEQHTLTMIIDPKPLEN